ncbi:MAG: PAS domain S-box protein, partial [Sulfuricaulis sp.]|nr:PAS domain S-box protein [Sulfuricaulis sp.]
MRSNPGPRGVPGRIVLVCGAITAGIGALILVGWALGWDALTTMGTRYIPMAPNSALLFVLLGSAVLVREVWPASRVIHRAAMVAALFSAVVAGVTLIGFLIGVNIDDWLFRTARMLGAVPIGRMSPVTAFCLVLAGVSLLLLECQARMWAAILGTLVMLVGSVCLIGYWFGTPLLYGGAVIPVALPASLALTALGAGLTAAAGPYTWPLNTLIGPSTRARLLRALLPTVVALALIKDWITAILLEHSDPGVVLASAMTAIAFLLVVSLVVSRVSGAIGNAIDRTQAERKQAEGKLLASETRYRRLFESAKDGILILDAETGMIVDVNPFLIELLGFSREEFLGKKIWELGLFKDVVASHNSFMELQQQEYIRFEDKPLKTSDGRRIDVEFVSNVYLVNHQKVIQCNIREITGRKLQEQKIARLSRIHAVLSGINSLIVRVSDRQELFNESCRIAVEQGGFGMAWIGVLNLETLELTPAASAGADAELLLAHSQNIARADGLISRMILDKRAVFSNDITVEQGDGGERRQEAIRLGYRSSIVLPLLVDDAVAGH